MPSSAQRAGRRKRASKVALCGVCRQLSTSQREQYAEQLKAWEESGRSLGRAEVREFLRLVADQYSQRGYPKESALVRGLADDTQIALAARISQLRRETGGKP